VPAINNCVKKIDSSVNFFDTAGIVGIGILLNINLFVIWHDI